MLEQPRIAVEVAALDLMRRVAVPQRNPAGNFIVVAPSQGLSYQASARNAAAHHCLYGSAAVKSIVYLTIWIRGHYLSINRLRKNDRFSVDYVVG